MSSTPCIQEKRARLVLLKSSSVSCVSTPDSRSLLARPRIADVVILGIDQGEVVHRVLGGSFKAITSLFSNVIMPYGKIVRSVHGGRGVKKLGRTLTDGDLWITIACGGGIWIERLLG